MLGVQTFETTSEVSTTFDVIQQCAVISLEVAAEITNENK